MEETAPVKAYVLARKLAKYEFELYPMLWERCKNKFGMYKAQWKSVCFSATNHDRIPREPGIYMFVVAPKHAYLKDHTYIFYVGKAKNLHRRYDEYLKEQYGEDLEHDREKIVDFLDRFKKYVYFHYHTCQENEIEAKEDYLVDHIFPYANSRHSREIKAIIAKAENA